MRETTLRLSAVFLLTALCGCSPTLTGLVKADRDIQNPATVEDDIAVYFSPGGGGMAAIIQEIDNAKKSIDVMAYLISTKEISDPLEAAHRRGVEVRVIMDAGNLGGIWSANAVMAGSPVLIWRDGEHKEYHHKVMLIDARTIITGSFNFTTQAEDTNAENLLIIRNKPKLYGAYLAHFQEHLQHSKPPGK